MRRSHVFRVVNGILASAVGFIAGLLLVGGAVGLSDGSGPLLFLCGLVLAAVAFAVSSRRPFGTWARPRANEPASGEDAPGRFRFSLKRMMALVLAVGVGFGLVMREVDRRRRESRVWGAIVQQREATFLVLNSPDPVVRQRIPALPLEWGGENFASGQDWVDSKKAWLTDQGRRRDVINLRVTGGATDDFGLKPIQIEDRGGELNGHFIGRLTEAFRSRKWKYRIVDGGAESGDGIHHKGTKTQRN